MSILLKLESSFCAESQRRLCDVHALTVGSASILTSGEVDLSFQIAKHSWLVVQHEFNKIAEVPDNFSHRQAE